MQNRIEWADQVKAFAISLMVLCHFGFASEGGIKFIYIFHMPVFFFISGYFDKTKPLDKKYIEKNFRTLIVPYFFFNICALTVCWVSPFLHPELYHNDGIVKTFFKAIIGMFLMQDLVRPYAFMPSGPLWFLVSLFEVRILFATFCGTIRKNKTNAILFFALLFIFFLLAYYKFFSTDASLMAFPIYAIGVAFKKCNVIERVTNKWQCAAIFAIGIIYLLFIGMKNEKISMDGADFGSSIIMFYINAIIGSLTFIFMFKAINVKWNWLSVVGASTLTILGTHSYIAIMGKVIGVKFLSINPSNEPLWFVLPLTIIGIVFGVYCHKLIMNKIPWVLGK